MYVKPWLCVLLGFVLPMFEGWALAQDDAPTVFLKGQVLKEDGTPADEKVRLELVCDNKIVDQTFPDLQGYFRFEVGGRSLPSDTSDASAPGSYRAGDRPTPQFRGGFGTMQSLSVFGINLNGCEIRVSSQNSYAKPVQLGVRSSFDDPDVGLIVLHSLARKGVTTVRQTTEAAPKEAKEAFQKAKEELSKDSADYALVNTELEKAVKMSPGFAAAWHLLGRARLAQEDRKGAREAFQQSIDADSSFVEPYVDLARLEFQERRWEEVSNLTDQLSIMDPEMPEAHFFGGLAKFYSDRIEDAEESLRWLDSKGFCSRFPLTYFYLGLIDTERGQIQLAAKELRLYLKSVPEAQVPEDWRKRIIEQLADWEDQGLIEHEQ